MGIGEPNIPYNMPPKTDFLQKEESKFEINNYTKSKFGLEAFIATRNYRGIWFHYELG